MPRPSLPPTGGSTNAALHLPAMAHECGIKFDLHDVARIFKENALYRRPEAGRKIRGTGYVPCRRHPRRHQGAARQRPAAWRLHHTVTGKTLAENHKGVTFPADQDVVYRVKACLSPTGGVVGLKGNLAPDGAIVKVAGMAKDKLTFRGPARCFDSEEAAFEAVVKGKFKEGDVLVIRYEGPKGGPGMREMLSTTAALYGLGQGEKVGADHRRPILGRHARLLLRRPCRSRSRTRAGPIGLLKNGDNHRHRCGQGSPQRRAFRQGAGQAPQGLEAEEEHVHVRCAVEVRPARRTGGRWRGDASPAPRRNVTSSRISRDPHRLHPIRRRTRRAPAARRVRP